MTRSVCFLQILAVMCIFALAGCRTTDEDQVSAEQGGQMPTVEEVVVETESGGKPVAVPQATIGLRGEGGATVVAKNDTVPEATPPETTEAAAAKVEKSAPKEKKSEPVKVEVAQAEPKETQKDETVQKEVGSPKAMRYGAAKTSKEVVSEPVKSEPETVKSEPVKVEVVKTEPKETPKTVESPSAEPTVAAAETPVSPFAGTVLLINLKKKFVVVDFSKAQMPPVKSELGVYRDGQFIGSVRITEPTKAPLATADIVQGVVRKGDSVR